MDTKTLSTVISIFILLIFGYIAKKTKTLKTDDVHAINNIIINITMPCFIFVSVHNKPLTMAMIKSPFLGFTLEIIVMLGAYLVSKLLKFDKPTTAAMMLVCAFGNTGFLGYPVVSAAFPGDKHAMLAAVMFDSFGMQLVLNTLGVAVACTMVGSNFDWKNIVSFLKNPMFPMTIIALIFRKIEVPMFIMQTMQYAALATIPLAMISIGLSLSTKSVTKYPIAFVAVVFFKMLFLPAILYFLMPIFGITGIVRDVVTVQGAMPSAVFTGIVSSRFVNRGEFAAGAIFLTTLLSVIIIPVILMLIR